MYEKLNPALPKSVDDIRESKAITVASLIKLLRDLDPSYVVQVTKVFNLRISKPAEHVDDFVGDMVGAINLGSEDYEAYEEGDEAEEEDEG